MNSQINAANTGHHTLTKYPSTYCTIVNEQELRHEMRDRHTELNTLIKKFSSLNKIKYLVITRGSKGSIFFEKKTNKFLYSQAYANNIKDKIGSGDVLMCIFAAVLKVSKSPELAMFIASVAAGSSVSYFANSEYVKKNMLLKSLKHLLI